MLTGLRTEATDRRARPTTTGPPNNIRQNLDAVVALVPSSKTATRVQELGADLYEYLKQLDFQAGTGQGR